VIRDKGVVLSNDGKRCVVLTPDGRFCTVPRAGNVGQEIEFRSARPSWRVLLAAASLFVILMTGTLFTSLFPAAGYVSVDINPSLELGMNAWGRVVRATGLNADGRDLLKGLPLYGNTLDQALTRIARQAEAMHYLKADNPDNTVVVAYTPGRLAFIRLRGQEEAYRALGDELTRERTPAKLVFARMTAAEKAQAAKMGLSAGKYLVRERLLAKGVNIPVEQMARTSIAELLRAERMRLDAIMGPDTVYREVRFPGTAMGSDGNTGKGLARISAAPPGKAEQQRPTGAAARPARVGAWVQRMKDRGGAKDKEHDNEDGGGSNGSAAKGPVWPMLGGGSASGQSPATGTGTTGGKIAPTGGGMGGRTGM